jgi:hypothetical protein
MDEGRLELVLANQSLREFYRGDSRHRLAVGRVNADRMGPIGQVDRLGVKTGV